MMEQKANKWTRAQQQAVELSGILARQFENLLQALHPQLSYLAEESIKNNVGHFNQELEHTKPFH